MKYKTQKQRVLEYLKRHTYITAIDGFTKFNPPITQIHTVIHELRVDGHDVECVMKQNKNTKTRFGKWTLK